MHELLHATARSLVAPGKGIIAADESPATMAKRFASIGLESNPENNRTYRELLFSTPDIEAYVSGVILYDETIRQTTKAGVPFATFLAGRGIIPGIKVDLGLMPLAGFPGEEVSKGIDTLHERLSAYAAMGAQFTKWRSVVRIGDGLPTEAALHTNARILALYAAIVQEQGLVPMVEPEVLLEGTHTLARSAEVLYKTLAILFDHLEEHRVSLPGLILKTSMALPGSVSGTPFDSHAIAHATLDALVEAVPASVAGVVFLSGGQTPIQATENLNAMAHVGAHPWPLTFSYSRAIEEPVIAAWRGEVSQETVAQQVLLARLRLLAAARAGEYHDEAEHENGE